MSAMDKGYAGPDLAVLSYIIYGCRLSCRHIGQAHDGSAGVDDGIGSS